MDPVSLTLAIVPLVGGAIKAYGILHKKLKMFQHYSRETNRLQKRIDMERRLFLNEIHLLLLAALGENIDATCMIEDPNHDKWKSRTLEYFLKGFLGPSDHDYKRALGDVSRAIEEMQAQIDCFGPLETERQEGERIRDTIRRLRDAAKITWDKSKIDDALTELHLANSDLQQLGDQVRKISSSATRNSRDRNLKAYLPPEYANFSAINRASNALHVALSRAWNEEIRDCQNVATPHRATLFLEAEVRDGVYMDMVLCCPGHASAKSCLPIPMPLEVGIHSQTLTHYETGLNSPPPSAEPSPSEDHQVKRQRVQLAGTSTYVSEALSKPARTGHDSSSGCTKAAPRLLDQDLCAALTSSSTLGSGLKSKGECLGYLNSVYNDSFRHSIYSFGTSSKMEREAFSMEQILEQSVDNTYTVVDQLRLARSLVAGVLKFHSTPWLAQYLTTRDISIFRNGQELASCLSTLHLDASFEAARPPSETPDDAARKAQNGSMRAVIEDARLDHGIRNMTLWCLGAILVQIGHWSTIESPDDVRAVRRLSYRVPSLGQRYQELARRCLECDYGWGEDLTRPRLRQAVYEKTYCELSGMIDSLDIEAY